MKTIYFVRHGESEVNIGTIFEGPESPLTEKGFDQARKIAERIAKLPIEIILSSKFERAVQTAAIIKEKIDKPVEHIEILGERLRLSRHYGHRRDDPIIAEEIKSLLENFTKPNLRMEDEENFEDLKERAFAVLNLLEHRAEKNILVIAHGAFLRFIVGAVLFGEKFNGYEGQRLLKAMKTTNTGVTVLLFDPQDDLSAWRLLTWNDHAHLG